MRSLPALLTLLLLVTAGCRRPAGKTSPPPVPVRVAVGELRTRPVEMTAIGTEEPIAQVQVKSKVQGEILAVDFADGARVAAGDILFRIDPRTYEAALRRAKANLAMAESGATNASEQARRYTALSNQGAASKEQFSQFVATAESRQAELDARSADVDEARLALDWTQVRSPINGRIGAALFKAGNIAQSNGEVLAVINQMQPIYVTFALPESALPEVRSRMEKGKPEVRVTDPVTGRELGIGELTFVDNAVDRLSGMVAFKATFANGDESLWPGQFVDVVLKLTEETDALVIPTTAIMEGQNGAQVFVVENDTARLQRVEVARTAGDLTILRSGLEPGAVVVTSGQLRVSPGARVSTKAAAP